MLVGDDLGLHVARLVEVALDEALPATECRDCLTGGRVEQFGDLFDRVGDLHAAAAAAECRLDGDGDTVLLGEGHDLTRVLDWVLGTRGHRCVGLQCDVTCGDLVTEVADRLGRRPDPGEPGVDDSLGEVGVLREEAVAGVDGVGPGLGRGVEDLVENQVRLGRGLTAQCESLVGELHEQSIGVRFGVHRDAGQSGVLGSPDDPYRDLASVGDEDFRECCAGVTWHLISCWALVDARR